jgi:hypothetical protein
MCIPDVLRIAGCLPAASTTGEKETTARLDCAGLVFTAQESGVAVRPAVFYFRHRVDDNPAELAKMRQVAGQVPGFVRDPALISQHGVSPAAGVIDAYSYLARMIDTDRYLAWLQGRA